MGLDKASFASFDARFIEVMFVTREKNPETKIFMTFLRVDKSPSLGSPVSQITQEHFRALNNKRVRDKLIKH